MKLIILVVLLIGVNAEDNDDTENFRICYEKVYEIAEKTDRTRIEFDARINSLPYECLLDGRQPRSCEEIYYRTFKSGIYNIYLSEYSRNPIQLECYFTWSRILSRVDGSVNFRRSWVDYKYGFGISGKEYFIGLDNLHALTNANRLKLAITIKTGEDIKEAFYSHFVIGNETEGYAIKSLGEYRGTAGDFLTPYLNSKFSTRDRDNDEDDNRNCAVEHNAAWWYKTCDSSSLNGVYDETSGKGINLHSLTGHFKAKVTMMIGSTLNF